MIARIQPFSRRTSPVAPLFDLGREVDSMFGDFFHASQPRRAGSFPALEVTENGETTVVLAEVPGVSKEDLKISLHEGLLTISGKRKTLGPDKGASTARKELWSGSFSRTVQVPHDVKADALQAELTDGMLTITLPKAEAARPHEIQIR